MSAEPCRFRYNSYQLCFLFLLLPKQKPPGRPGAWNGCLAVTYFHMGIHTIIGAESFHGPVRDGKAWDQLAMAARLKLYKSVSRYGDSLRLFIL